MIRILRGGSTGANFHVGPGVFKESYKTVVGWSDRIAAASGEAVAKIRPGSPEHFSVWIVGPIQEIVTELRKRGEAGLAESIARSRLPKTPAEKLANALPFNISAETVARAAFTAGVRIRPFRMLD